MDVPAVVFALVLAEAGVGGLALLWFAPTWGAVRHGYEMLLGASLALMTWGAWAALQAPLDAATAANPELADAATWVSRGLLATTIVAAAAVVVLAVKLPPILGRVLGIASTLLGLASFVPLAMIRAERGRPGGVAQGVLELVLGAALLGAIWDGLVLGHWYLVERRLSNRYMVWMSWANVVAVVAGLGAVLLSARNPVPCAGATGAALEGCVLTFSPLLTVGSLTITMGVGVIALIAVIAGFNVKLAQEGGRSIQASTGMFYLAVILAPAAEFAAKVRYF
ncbi:MAG: hypothetical protein R3320_06825 [Nitriliruptorales bacterium]|nr:hypothetical protein [Nitriliruptorales bacterium]